MEKLIAIPAASLALMLATSAMADPVRVRLDLGGTFDWAEDDSIDASLGFAERQSLDSKLRLIWQSNSGPWSFEVQSLLSYQEGDNVAFANAMAGPPVPPPSFFNLTSDISSDATHSLTHTLDRLSVTYASGSVVFKAGRQAVTWGSGMLFHPSDIIAPFAPNAIDTAYKPGVEMLYGQYLFDNGNDMEAVFVPRRAVEGGPMEWDQSTLALRATLLLGELDGSAMLAQDHGDTLVNLSLGGPVGDAAWNAEIGHWFLADGASATNYLVNFSNSGTIAEMNITYFAEYFHNGFGVDTATPLDEIPEALATRLSTGQLFNVGQDFLALGGMLGITPGVTLSPSIITSLNDGSSFGSLHLAISASDSLDFSLSASKGFGENGTEFGGRETSSGSGEYLRAPTSAAIQVTKYF